MRWLLSNVRSRALFAARHPAYTIRSLLREATHADEKFLSALTGCSAARLRGFLDEPLGTPEFARVLREAEDSTHGLDGFGADLYGKKVLVQYAAIRAFRPAVVVETGVANGVSSSYLLLAMEKNGVGKLHSIDIGDNSYVPAGKTTGWIVPEFLKGRWDFRIGDCKILLPKLLLEIGSIDVFIHDSLHVYDHMLWEYRAAYPYLRPGGLLFSDDALWNRAFPEFVLEARAVHHGIVRGVGFLKKPAFN
jgi:predicted O-methyltransferase YrrM